RLPVDRTFDLLQVGDRTKTLGELDLVSGTITELRLALDEQGDNRVLLTNGQSCVLDLSRFPSAGVSINDPTLPVDFDDRHHVRLVVDFGLAETLTQGDPCRFALVPGVEIKSLERQGEEAEPTTEPVQPATDTVRAR